jgi:hypothetical protein
LQTKANSPLRKRFEEEGRTRGGDQNSVDPLQASDFVKELFQKQGELIRISALEQNLLPAFEMLVLCLNADPDQLFLLLGAL